MEQFKLRLLFWETTQKCNLSCSHCRMDAEKTYNELDTEQSKLLIDSIVKFASPILVLSGGEPLLRQDIFELAHYAKEKQLDVALATNGTLIDSVIINKIINNDIKRISISLDAATSEKHDSFRNCTGAFNKALEGIALLVNSGISTQINTTITRHNVTELEDIINLAINHKCDALHLFLVVPVGCGQNIATSDLLSAFEYEETLKHIYNLSLKYKDSIFIKLTCAPQYYRILKQEKSTAFENSQNSLHKVSKGCLAGTNVCFISAEGNVYPCGYLPISAGNIITTELKDIWNNSEVFKTLRDINNLQENCRSCDFLNVCGGCRARAYFAGNNNFMAADPNCIINATISEL